MVEAGTRNRGASLGTFDGMKPTLRGLFTGKSKSQSDGLTTEERKALLLEEAKRLGAERAKPREYLVIENRERSASTAEGEMPEEEVWQSNKMSSKSNLKP